MNYIKHLNAAMERFVEDNRLNPTHVSMYLALFQYWNLARFRNPLSISREQIMQLSKIGSKATYHKCIKDLDNWGYLKYEPSHNPLRGSLVYMFNFETTPKQVKDNYSSTNNEQVVGQVLVPSINSKNKPKHKERKQSPPTLEEVKIYFQKHFPPLGEMSERQRGTNHTTHAKTTKQKRRTEPVEVGTSALEKEAQKFHNHYTSVGWKIGKSKMQDWQAAAQNWIIRANEHQLASSSRAAKRRRIKSIEDDQNMNSLHAETDKDYDQPL